MDLSRLEKQCLEQGVRLTDQRRVVLAVLSESDDHPNVEQLHQRAVLRDRNISVATVYRTLRILEEAGILERHDFREGKSRYEQAPTQHHDHLIDLKTGRVIEFQNEEIEALQREIAKKLGYALVDHRLELYGVPLEGENIPPEEDGP